MALPLFSTWSLPEVIAAIRELERGIAGGSKTIQYPNQGMVELVPRAEALQTLTSLYGRKAELEGLPNPTANGGIRLIRVLPRLGY